MLFRPFEKEVICLPTFGIYLLEYSSISLSRVPELQIIKLLLRLDNYIPNVQFTCSSIVDRFVSN